MVIKGPPCGIENCRSKRYEEGEDGHLYCQNGHQQAGAVRGEDEDDYISAARTVTRKKNPVEEDDTTFSRIYKGPQAFDLYLKCLQLILRHQVWFLVHDKGLPAELETVVHDLWALRIVGLEDKIASNEDASSNSQSQSQVFNTLESEDEGTDMETGHVSGGKGRRGNRLSTAPNLSDCLALCYLGFITLRLPCTPGDLHAWVTDGNLAYRRAIRLLPLAMRERLPPAYRAVLDPSAQITYPRFYKTLTDLQKSYDTHHGIIWPPLNVPLLLLYYLRALALPLELYDATRRLGELLGYDFAPHYVDKKRLGIRDIPEAQLISCLLICIKLLYPLGQEQRYCRTQTENSAMQMNWDAWCKEMKAVDNIKDTDAGCLTAEAMAKLQEKDVFNMSPAEMDQYLDFYADTFLDDAEIQRTKDADDFRNALFDMFPIESDTKHPPKRTSRRLPLSQELELVKRVQSMMVTVPKAGDANEPLVEPGQAYPLWKTQDDLPEAARVLFEKAAKLAGLSMNMLLVAVKFTEASVEQWKRVQRRGG
ncbi:rna polymerase i specific transcription initiation factor rrn7 [Curvularia clavata]|uniref:Rna polymerase i specific transcription initiation factor rrn7 n=1 Tax=Curvularia clavata TaxID=95742 RepID=A0A9Q9DPV4_CURCL|nr:rna polymerase i specific transcription initiation factor rrn7 [Curvularia clavata]